MSRAKSPSNNQVTSIVMSEETLLRLKIITVIKDTTMNELVRSIINEWLSKREDNKTLTEVLDEKQKRIELLKAQLDILTKELE